MPPLVARPATLGEEKRLLHEDQVELPRLYLAWPGPPSFSPADAALTALAGVLADGKNSRLYKRLVYDLQVAQDVSAFVNAGALTGAFHVIVTARSSHTLEEIRALVDEEIAKLQAAPPAERELQRFVNQREASVYDILEQVGLKADALNGTRSHRRRRLLREDWPASGPSPDDLQAAAGFWLGPAASPVDRAQGQRQWR